MVADELIGSLENTHYYLNQEEGVKEHLSREILHDLPTLWLNPEKSMFEYTYDDIKILGYEAQPKINYPLSN
jgi:thymidylate synthase